MSMSQEEIEALMNGLDFEDEGSKEKVENEEQETSQETNEDAQKIETTEDSEVSKDDINDVILQNEQIVNEENNNENGSVDEILNNIDENEVSSDSNDNIDELLEEINETKENSVEDNKDNETLDTQGVDDILNNIDFQENTASLQEDNKENVKDEAIVDIEDTKENISIKDEDSNAQQQESIESSEADIDSKIDNGVFPFPVEKDNKVVNQLSQVANDSEEKATKIFDVLSNILDYNNEIQNDVQELASFSEKQTMMLASLNQKFPKIDVFKDNLEQAEKMSSFISDINDKLNNGNNEIFQAMELMQYHDINRQKIERVMSVIRKLSVYLNNLFEDESDYQEIAVAKHIHGDSSTGDLMAEDDLDALIAEFNK